MQFSSFMKNLLFNIGKICKSPKEYIESERRDWHACIYLIFLYDVLCIYKSILYNVYIYIIKHLQLNKLFVFEANSMI